MELRQAIKENYHKALAMLAECVQKCPADLWTSPAPRVDDENRFVIRSFWRIAFHAVYFTHLYLGQNEGSFQAWPGAKGGDHEGMWHAPWNVEPYELPEDAEVHTQEEMLDYIKFVDSLVAPTVDQLDLDTSESGFPWYPRTTKIGHQLLNLRHIQGHVGQLSELLWMRGIETDWP